VKLKQTNTRLLQLKLDKEGGLLIEVQLVRQLWGQIIRGLRQFVLGLPGAIAFEIPVLTATDRSIMDRVCRDGLHDASLERGFDFDTEVPGEDVSDPEAKG
jgi:hypothetical protein